MEFKDIKKLIELITANDLSEFEMEDQGFRIAVRRGGEPGPAVMMAPHAAPQMMAPAPAPASAPPVEAPAVPTDDGFEEIISPIVGTFYRASAPDADAFATVGMEVSEDTVVCIIEAMKAMNEIKAECRGIIKEVLVENATPVEYGQPLFKIQPL